MHMADHLAAQTKEESKMIEISHRPKFTSKYKATKSPGDKPVSDVQKRSETNEINNVPLDC